MTFFHQLKLLLWKNFLLRKRHKVRIVLEILWPLILFLILMWVRRRGLRTPNPACHLIEKTLPSVGGFPFLQNFICTLNNACHNDLVEDGGGQDLWKNATFPEIVAKATPILDNLVGTPARRQSMGNLVSELNIAFRELLFASIKNEIKDKGDVKLKSFLISGGEGLFRTETQNDSLFLKDSSYVNELLETTVHLDQFSRASYDAVDTLFSGINYCSLSQVNFPLFTMNDTLFTHFCSERARVRLIRDSFETKVDNSTDLYLKMKRLYDEEAAGVQVFNPLVFGAIFIKYASTVGNLQTLASQVTKLVRDVPELSNQTSRTNGNEQNDRANDLGMTALMANVYKGICGLDLASNPILGTERTNTYDTLRDRLRDWRNRREYEWDPELSTICNTVFRNLEERSLTSVIWKQIKPFVRGRILYYPFTNFTKALMDRVDEKFGEFKKLENNFNQAISILHRFRSWFNENKAELKLFQELVRNDAALAKIFPNAAMFKNDPRLQPFILDFTSRDLDQTEANIESMDLASELDSEIINCYLYKKSTPYDFQNKPYESEDAAVKQGMSMMLDNNLWALVVFKDIANDSIDPTHLKYTIRMDSDKVDGTRFTRERLTRKGPRRRPTIDMKYLTNGFIYIQEIIEHSFIEMTTNEDMKDVSMVLQQFPFPCYIFDQFIKAISNTFPMFMILSWVYASAMLIKSIVLEKELRLKEVMRVMGCGNSVIWTAWFVDSFVMMSVSCVILALILKFGKVVENSDFSVLLLFLIIFAIATISFSFLVSTFFTKANSAAATGGILFFVSYLPYNFMLIWEDRLTWYQTLASCIISNVAFGFGCTYIARLEEDGLGARWDRITIRTLPGDDFNFSYCLLMLVFDSILYMFLTLYIEAVFPGENGMPKKWYFLFQKSFWFPKAHAHAHADGDGYTAFMDSANKPVVETEPEGMLCGVSVQHLCKKYSNGRVALADLNMSFYEGQITSFLGHNGAGKTTTISILTGLFPPSEGTAFIYGFDITKDINVVRRNLGICPQHNVLFDRLNVEEHLLFYAGLKGKQDVAKMEMDQMLLDLGIPHKKTEFPNNLSGGMKRKLSVAIAFVGGSRTVFLDEPTSGVDPYSRRSIWELLLHYKQGRTIILTTHFMDEADILGDRIAIISRGRLKACGTSLFLKAQFGQGYFLRLVREIAEQESADEVILNNVPPSTANDTISHASKAQSYVTRNAELTAKHAQLFAKFIKQRIPETQLVSDAGSDVIFLLPNNKVSEFQLLFQDLDENMGALKVQSYGISDTSLEDVFLQITVEDLEEAELKGERSMIHSCTAHCCTKLRAAVWNMRRRLKKKKKMSNQNSAIAINVTSSEISIQPKPNIRRVSPEIEHRLSSEQVEFNRMSISEELMEPDRSLGLPIMPISMERFEASPSPPGSIDSTTPLDHQEITGESAESEQENEEVILPPPSRKSSGLLGIKRDNIHAKFWIQIWVIILKRFRNSNRNKKAIFFEVIFPAVFVALMLASTLILPPPSNEGIREITFKTYRSPNNIFFAKPDQYLERFDDTVNQLAGPYTLGNPCLDDVIAEGECRGGWNEVDVNRFLNTSASLGQPSLGTCSCRSGSQMCDSNMERPPPPRLTTRTKDFLLDVSNYHVSEWVIKTYYDYDPTRLGGYEMFERPTPDYTPEEFITLFEMLSNVTDNNRTDANRTRPKTKAERPAKAMYKIWYENRAWLSSTAYLNALNNVILRQQAARGGLISQWDELGKYGITLYTHPMNLTDEQQKKESIKTAALGVIHAICMIFALSFVPASFTVYLIEERKSGAKHLHLISGVKPVTYWISNFCFDMLKYLFSAALCLILFYIFDARAYISDQSVGAFITLLILYGWAAIPLMYPASYIFGVPSTAFVVLACLNLFIGIITTVSTFVLDQLGDEELKEISEVLQQLFLIFPHYCLGRGLIELVKLHLEATAFRKLDFNDIIVDRFEWNILGKLLLCLFIQGFCFFTLSILVEYRQWAYMLLCKKRIDKKEQRIIQDRITGDAEDEDVRKEAIRVTQNPPKFASLLAQNLGKIYSGKKRPAVNNISFAVDPGECFGLLGVNGAGKSTTFKMLTGDVRITTGKAYIMSWDVEKSLDEARKHYGYCPQEDGIDPLLNSYEQLELYGRLRGLTLEEVRETATQLITQLGLTRYAYKRCGTYSGGNKRKISTAIALVGNPDVLFLDEPTSGMDPGARRQLWKVVIAVTRMGKAVVLTSHSMEECEALCSRLAIMVNGRFTCLGSLQHLKNRFGKGYQLTVRCPVPNQSEFLASLQSSLPFATLEDAHSSQLKFNIPQEETRLSNIFSVMCIARTEGLIEDFSVSQTTLDDIFIKFASEQRDELDTGKAVPLEDPAAPPIAAPPPPDVIAT